MQNKQQAVEFMEMYQDELLENHRLEKERECKINSVFSLMDTRQIIFKQKKQILDDERTKIEEDLIDQYFSIKCQAEIECVRINFISVIKGNHLIGGARHHFINNLKQFLKKGLTPIIFKRNKDYIRGATYRTLKRFTIECEKYIDIMEQRSIKNVNGEQFIIEHEGITYKLFNRAGRKINSKINNKFLDHYIKDAVTTVEAERNLKDGLRFYMQRYLY